MIDLPSSTVVNRFVPKEKFYSKTSITTKLRQLFTDEIERITWTHKISPETLNISAGDYQELQVFEIALKGDNISDALLRHIDTFIPYPILFVIKSRSSAKTVMSFKEPSAKNEHVMKVDSYYDTGWRMTLDLTLHGRSVDEIYKNYLYQIAPDLRDTGQTDVKVAAAANKERAGILRQVESLKRKMATEPSAAKRQELARERHKLQQMLEKT